MLESNCLKRPTHDSAQVTAGRLVAWRVRQTLLLTWLWCGLAGCETPVVVGMVSGKITLQDKPVTEGYIAFNSRDQGVAAGANLSAAGAYQLTSPLPIGSYVVTISPPPAPPPLSAPANATPPTSEIPAKYRDETTSDLKFDVEEGENTGNFDLQR